MRAIFLFIAVLLSNSRKIILWHFHKLIKNATELFDLTGNEYYVSQDEDICGLGLDQISVFTRGQQTYLRKGLFSIS